ncbi:MAG: hypothetical protein U0452_06160 [Anaerolineae bacterium]
MIVTFVRNRSFSLSMVVLVLGIILVLQSSLSYSITFGSLKALLVSDGLVMVSAAWIAIRVTIVAAIVVLWFMNRRRMLFRAIMFANGVFTFALVVNMIALVQVLFGVSSQDVDTLIFDVVLMAVANILIFSIWYWIIDPPGVNEDPRDDEPWDFLFPQRAGELRHYEDWQPRYTDYLFLAFTSSFAFSPTDTLPLTRRAKALMMIQSAISLVTITAIAGSAINILASG